MLVAYIQIFLASLFFNDLAHAAFCSYPRPFLNTKPSIVIAAAGSEGGVQKTETIAEEETQMEVEQRNLRFAGIGRLYTTADDLAESAATTTTSTTSSVEPHIAIVERLAASTVVVIGLGGVGSWAAEALCRSGVGSLILIDLDDICISNTNRQVHALSSTIGQMKIDIMKRRLQEINPHCNITLIHDFVSIDNSHQLLSQFSNNHLTACLDAIDGAASKSALLAACSDLRIPIVTCGGTAGRQDPTKLVCDDLTRVSGDRLLSACRKNLRKYYGFSEGLDFEQTRKGRAQRKWNIKAIFSAEPPKLVPQATDESSLRRCDGALGTASFVTGTAGFIAAGKIVEMITKDALKPPVRRKRQ